MSTRDLTACVLLASALTACTAPPGIDVVARWSGGEITRQEFETYLESLDKRRVRTDASIPAEEAMRELLREYAANRILAAEAPETESEEILYLSPRARHLVHYYRQRTGKRTHEVTDEEARAVYEERLENRYTLPESIRFQHIFLRRDRHEPAELEALERRVLAELSSGVEFADVVARYSESGSKDRDGVVGPVFRGRLEQSFEDQLFALPAGDRPAVLRTELGDHVVRVLSRKEPRVLPFEEVRSRIVGSIIEKKNEAERRELFARLRERFGVVDRTGDGSLEDDDIVLTVKDRSLSRAGLEHYLEGSAPFGAAHRGADPRARRAMIDDLIDFNLMYLDALEQGLHQEPNFQDRWRSAEIRQKASTALQERVARWTENVDDDVVLAYFREHESRFALPQRFEVSYIYLPFGARPPFEVQTRIEELAKLAGEEGFSSPTFTERCVDEGALCVDAGLISTREAARIGPKFQRALLAMEQPGITEPIKAENGLYIVTLHGAEERRPLVPPEDMERIRERYVVLERKRITSEIREQLLEERGFRVVALLATNERAESTE